MAGDTTKQMLARISWLPDRDDGDNGSLIAGQDYDDVFIAGGVISNVTLSVDSITLANPLEITSGGTNANNATDARTNLGLAIGSDVQAWSTNLDTFSGITFSTDGTVSSPSDTEVLSSQAIVTYVAAQIAAITVPDADYGDITVSGSGTVWTIDAGVVSYSKIQNTSGTDVILGRSTAGAGVVEEISCTAAGRALLDDASASDQRTTMGVAIGSDVQAFDANLSGITSFGGTLIANANAADARTDLDVYSTTEVDTAISNNNPVLSSPVTLTTQTSVDFTALPSGISYIEFMIEGMSENSTSDIILQLGDSGGFETSGYLGNTSWDTGSGQNYSNGFELANFVAAAQVFHGVYRLYLLDSSTNTWTFGGGLGRSDSNVNLTGWGSKSLSGELTQIRMTTDSGTAQFDAGKVNIRYK